jgi:hypothetical protein
MEQYPNHNKLLSTHIPQPSEMGAGGLIAKVSAQDSMGLWTRNLVFYSLHVLNLGALKLHGEIE